MTKTFSHFAPGSFNEVINNFDMGSVTNFSATADTFALKLINVLFILSWWFGMNYLPQFFCFPLSKPEVHCWFLWTLNVRNSMECRSYYWQCSLENKSCKWKKEIRILCMYSNFRKLYLRFDIYNEFLFQYNELRRLDMWHENSLVAKIFSHVDALKWRILSQMAKPAKDHWKWEFWDGSSNRWCSLN